MEKIILKAEARKERTLSRLRKDGYIPAVVYGKEEESVPLEIFGKDFIKIFSHVGENVVFGLALSEGKKYNVLVRDIERHPLTGNIVHIDFYAVNMDEEVETTVELEYKGESPLVKGEGGILVRNIDEVTVKALPKDIPSTLIVDISSLVSFDDVIHIKDLVVSDKVEILADPETILVSVSRPRTEADLEADSQQPDVSQVEVVEKGKKEKEVIEEDAK
ncbi:MAG: 50S ribosomal protein L25 [Candidatus Moranbacteria bacterium]|nr:50S ribosomal protein L25 [Candidatus Moranbacteria bacterium]